MSTPSRAIQAFLFLLVILAGCGTTPESDTPPSPDDVVLVVPGMH